MFIKKAGLIMLSSLLSISCASSDKCSYSSETLKQLSIELLSYTVKNEKGKILILPPTGGTTYLEKRYAKQLCNLGFSAIIIKKWKDMEKESLELDIHAELLGKAQEVIAQVIEEKTQAEDFIGILGTSVGAIHSATALGIQDKIQAGFLILGGAPIHKVIAYSEEKTLTEYRNKRMKAFAFKNKEEYAIALNKKIPKRIRPLTFSDKVKQKNTFAVIALKDKVVPTEYQKELRKAFDSNFLEISSGHIIGILEFYLFHSKKVSQFFENSLTQFKKDRL